MCVAVTIASYHASALAISREHETTHLDRTADCSASAFNSSGSKFLDAQRAQRLQPRHVKLGRAIHGRRLSRIRDRARRRPEDPALPPRRDGSRVPGSSCCRCYRRVFRKSRERPRRRPAFSSARACQYSHISRLIGSFACANAALEAIGGDRGSCAPHITSTVSGTAHPQPRRWRDSAPPAVDTARGRNRADAVLRKSLPTRSIAPGASSLPGKFATSRLNVARARSS